MNMKSNKMRKAKWMTCALFALAMAVISFTAADTAYADSDPVAESLDGTTKYYYLADAWRAASSNGVKIKLLADWRPFSDLRIDEGKEVYIDMNGHSITRTDADESNGEVFCLDKNVKLTLTAGKDVSRNFIFEGGERDGSNKNLTSGGLVTGGTSTGGAGGIHMKYGSELTLDNVAVAGNRSKENWIGAHGQGAGIYIADNYCKLTMKNNAQIAYNYADDDGGGIYSNGKYTTITMDEDSSIYNNSGEDGGGICLSYTFFSVTSTDNTAEISHNRSRVNSDRGGGGICIERNFIGNYGAVKGITFNENSTSDRGGALYIKQTGVTVSNCKIKGNKASEGGGIYNENSSNTISGCTIENNEAEIYGGGVLANYEYSVGLSGKLIIKNNTRKDGSADDLFLQGTGDTRAYLNGSTSSKSEIGIRTAVDGERTLSSAETFYYEDAFFSDDDGYYIEFQEDKGQLYKKSGSKPEKTASKDISPDTEKKSETYNGKAIIKGSFSYPSVVETTEDLDSVFYYSDGYFLDGQNGKNGDPKVYDSHLATMSMSMAMAAFYSNIGNDGELTSNDRTYTYKSQNIEKLMTDIGVEPDDIYIRDTNTVKPSTDSIGVAIGQKVISTKDKTGTSDANDTSDTNDANDTNNKNNTDDTTAKADLENDYILVPVAIRGAGYEAEWCSNTTAGESGEHAGFANAADQVLDQVNTYISSYGLEDAVKAGRVKFWVMGYSRAGATSNLTAKRLIEKYCSGTDTQTSNQVYAYCFEAPKGGTNSAMKLDESKYYSIHNCINKVDLVPLVTPEEMGLIRYGVDHYIPGEARASDVKSDSTVWSFVNGNDWAKSYKTWSDNNSYTVGTEDYKNQRVKMKQQLTSVDPEYIVFYDQFKPAYARYIASMTSGQMFEPLESKGGNLTQEQYLRIFWRSFQAWGLYNGYEKNFRGSYVKYTELKDSVSFQASLQSMTKIVFSKSNEDLNGMMNSISAGMSDLQADMGQMFLLWKNILGHWANEDYSVDVMRETRTYYLGLLWDSAMEYTEPISGKKATDYLTDSEEAEMRIAWNTLGDVLLHFADMDYKTDIDDWNDSKTSDDYQEDRRRTTPITEGITSEHTGYDSNSQVVLATLVYNMTAVAQGHYPEINYAWVRSYDTFYNAEITPVDVKTDIVPEVTAEYDKNNDSALVLSTSTKGAGIYYRIKEGDESFGDWKPYNKPVTLASKDGKDSTYTVQMTASYCGNTSDVVEKTYTVKGSYTVTVNNKLLGKFRAGSTVTIDGTAAGSSKVFRKWSQTDGVELADVNSAVTTFEMPARNVSLTADYVTSITSATLSVDAPTAGKALPAAGTLSWEVTDDSGQKQEQTKEVSVYWMSGDQQAAGNAGYNTKYAIAANIAPADGSGDEPDMVFSQELSVETVKIKYNEDDPQEPAKAYVDAEGHLIIIGAEMTTDKAAIDAVTDVTVSVSEGSTEAQLKDRLPSAATVKGEDGEIYTVAVDIDKANLSGVIKDGKVKAEGGIVTVPLKITDEDAVTNPDDKQLTVTVAVQKKQIPSEPTVDKDSGTYKVTSLAITPSCDTTGAQIWYSINGGESQKYTKGTIDLSGTEGEKRSYIVTIWAETEDGSRSSDVIRSYVLDLPYTVTINGKDTALKKDKLWDEPKKYTYYKGDMITLMPPLEDDECFEKWEEVPKGITEDENTHALTIDSISQDIELTAIYNPVIKQIDLTMDEPSLGRELAGTISKASVTVTKTYDATKYFSDIQWSPNAGMPAYDTAYTAKLTIKEGAAADMKFFLAENITINVNGKDSKAQGTLVREDGKDVIYVTFPRLDKAELIQVSQPDDVAVSREAAAKGKWNLPSETMIMLSNGNSAIAKIEWGTLPTFDESDLQGQSFKVSGTVVLPDYVKQGSVSTDVTINVSVPSADTAAMPVANYPAGEYTGKISVRLSSTTEGATIYYTLDGSVPTTESTVYDGKTIDIGVTDDKGTTLKAIAVKDGMLPSAPASYTYTVKEKKKEDLTIVNKGWNKTDENQSFVFSVKGDPADENTKDIYTEVVIHGNGKKTIKDLPVGKYTVTEQTGWSWRYSTGAATQTIDKLSEDDRTVTFTNTRKIDKWLNGSTWCENVFGKGSSSPESE